MLPTTHALISRLRLRILVAATLALLGVIVAFGSWARPTRPMPLVAVWGDRLHTPLVPNNLAASNDRTALLNGGYFRAQAIQLAIGSKDLLEQGSPAQSRVVYVSAYATRADDGRVLLMTEDFDPISGSGGLSLDTVLAGLERQQAPSLLVLDLSWRLAEGRAGLAPCGVGAVVHERLRRRSDSPVLTLVSCAPGETPNKLPLQRRTTFGRFFEAGMQGAADGFNPSGVTDGRVSACELARYLTNRVAVWTEAHGEHRQQPVLYGNQANDFVLGPCRDTPSVPTNDEESFEYPEWLAQAWRDHADRNNCVAARVAPRLLSRIEAELLDAERAWRWTGSTDAAAAQFESNTRSLARELDHAVESVSRSAAISAAEISSLQDDELVQLWLARLATAEAPTAEPKPAESNAADAAFAKQIEDATEIAQSHAAIVALMRAGKGFRSALETVVRIERSRSASAPLVETAACGVLADFARDHPEATDVLLAEFFRTVVLREQVLAGVRSTKCFAEPLSEACALQQSAWAMLMSPGYADREQARRVNRRADRRLLAVQAGQRLRLDAERTSRRAMRILPRLAPLVRIDAVRFEDWRAACKEAGRLYDTVASLASPTPTQLDRMQRQTASLSDSLDRLSAAVSSAAIERLTQDVLHGDRAAAVRAEAALATALLAAEDRAALYAAVHDRGVKLATQLHAYAYNDARAVPGTSDTPSRLAESSGPREWLLAQQLLVLAGLPPTESVSKDPPDDQHLASIRRLRSALVSVRETDFSLWADNRLERAALVLPATAYNPVLDRPGATPTLRIAKSKQSSVQRFRSRLLLDAASDIGGGSTFARLARRLNANVETPTRWVYEPSSDKPSSKDRSPLSVAQPYTTSRFSVVHDKSLHTDVSVSTPTKCIVASPRVADHRTGSMVEIDLQLRGDAPVSQRLKTSGVLVRFRCGDRLQHVRLPTPQVSGVSPVQVWLELAGARVPWSKKIALPPTATANELAVVVQNHKELPIRLEAELEAGLAYHAEATIEGLAEGPLPFQLTGEPPQEPWTPASKLRIKLNDGEQTLFESEAELSVSDPGEYVRVRDARLLITDQKTPRLRMLVERLAGSPDPLRMIWSLHGDGGSVAPVVVGGSLAAELTREAPIESLEADLRIPPSALGRLQAVATINGVEDALAWRTTGPIAAGNAVLSKVIDPVIRLKADELVAAGEPLNYTIEALGAPRGARLEVSLEPVGDDATFGFGGRHAFPYPRDGKVAVSPAASGVGLIARAAHAHWSRAFATDGQVGHRLVVARLLDADRKELARAAAPTTIDGDPPEAVQIAAVGPAIAAKPVSLRVDGVDALSGVSTVRVYVGLPDAGAPPAGSKPVVAKRGEAGWVAKLPLPAEPGELVVSAELTNGAGLQVVRSVMMTSMDPSDAALGAIVGAVTEATRPQPGLKVQLLNDQQQVVATSQTDGLGAFRFSKLKPGAYQVTAVKAASQRTGATSAEVKPGKEAPANIRLTL